MTAGNALRMDQDLRAIGVDLDAEFAELGREVPISDGAPGPLARIDPDASMRRSKRWGSRPGPCRRWPTPRSA